MQSAVGVGLDPGDVVPERGHFPTLLRKFWRRDEHREVGLAAGAGKSRCDIGLLTLRVFDAEDEHVFGHPAVVSRHVGGDAEGEALLAEQRVAAVTRTVAPNLA